MTTTSSEGAGTKVLAPGVDEVVDAIVRAHRSLVGVVERSLEGFDVTPGQFRALSVLAQGGSQRLLALAEALAVAPSTATRICDHIVRRGLASRERDKVDRREVRLALTPKGSHLITEVLARRREELVAVVEALPLPERQELVGLLSTIAGCSEAPVPAVPLLLRLGG